jgi:hypothetical protein
LQNPHTPVRWKLGLLAAVAVMLLSLYPQLNLWIVRGRDWQGSYAHVDSDEVAYSAYLAALIDGRPRRNDPYTGRDDATGQRQAESLFSIQFIPPYLLALAARLCGFSANTVFMLLMPVISLAAALAIFWLMWLLTSDDRVAAASVLIVLCLGTFGPVYVSWQTLRGMDTTYAFGFLPFLRRFQPATSFPFFFLFCAFVWRTLRSRETRALFLSAAASSLTFGLLVFSYFYLWTAALAWLLCLALVLFIARPSGWQRDIKRTGLILATSSLALIPYYVLLSGRAPSMDATQLLALSRAPDLFHWSEVVGWAALALLVWGGRRGLLARARHAAIFAASFALVPLIVFNQQVVTGRSLQPLHYDLFIAKYVALVALVLTAVLIWRGSVGDTRRIPGRVLCVIALAAFGWGLGETVVATIRCVPLNIGMDESRRAALRLAELARSSGQERPVALSTDIMLADTLPTDARLAVLWSPHLQVFAGASASEHKERIYKYLYYTGVNYAPGDEQIFERLDPQKKYFIHALLGWGRSDPAWNAGWQPVTNADVLTEMRSYRAFVASFNREQAAQPTLSYFVAPVWQQIDFTNLDRWYERDTGEQVGGYVIYRLKLRPESSQPNY